jgi:hypothetical protein
MKLIREIAQVNKSNFVKCESAGGRYYIEGIFLQADMVNRNNRRYPSRFVESAVNQYQRNYIDTHKSCGEMEHPDSPNINYERACIKTVSLIRDGTNWIGKGLVLSTPMGQLVESLIRDEVALGVSSRALASSKFESGVEVIGDDLTYCAIDVVSDPSAQDAWVNGVLERKEYVINNGIISEKTIGQALKARDKKIDFAAIGKFLSAELNRIR